MKRFALILGLGIFLIMGCAKKNELTGTWNYYTGNEVKDNIYYIFNNDYTGIYNFNENRRTFTYSIENDTLKIKYNEKDMNYYESKYMIENNILKIRNSFNENVMYKKR